MYSKNIKCINSLLSWTACIALVGMFAGFIFSRALLSIGMILLLMLSIFQKQFFTQLRVAYQHPFVFLSAFFFCFHLISGWWSENTDKWLQDLQMKIPYLVLPFAFSILPFQDKRKLLFTIAAIILTLSIGIIISYSHLFSNLEQFLTTGKHFRVSSGLQGDYIRFTIALALSLVLIVYVWFERKRFTIPNYLKIIFIIHLFLTISYLHIQLAKSGILCFYIIVGIFLFVKVHRKKMMAVVASLIALLSITFLLIKDIPTVQTQLSRAKLEYKVWKNDDMSAYHQTSSFVPRIKSYEIAIDVIKKHPLIGVGIGDVYEEMEAAYEKKYPMISNTLIPHNQFIFTALALGMPVSLLTLCMLMTPLFKLKQSLKVYVWATFVPLFVSMFIEALFETQHGTFVYLVFTLFWMQVGIKTNVEIDS